MSSLDLSALGDRGETQARLALTEFHGDSPLFRPVFLGEKWPVSDMYVELVSIPGHHFIVQIKTTTLGYTKGNRLKVQAKKDAFNKLANMPQPTYLLGVDEINCRVFIAAATKPVPHGISSIPTTHDLGDANTRLLLHDEVQSHWATTSSASPWRTSHFSVSLRA